MAKRRRRRPRAVDLTLTALLSLFLAIVCLTTQGPAPQSFSAALEGSASARLPVGPVGSILGQVALWALGPIFLWVLPLLPWSWVVLNEPRRRGLWLRRLGWATVTLVGLAGFVAHPQWSRVGLDGGLGGALGRGVERGLASLVGDVGSFLALGFLSSWLVLRSLPPLRFPLPALDGLLEKVGPALAGLRAPLSGLVSRVTGAFAAAGARLGEAARAFREERRRGREEQPEPEMRLGAGEGDEAIPADDPFARRRDRRREPDAELDAADPVGTVGAAGEEEADYEALDEEAFEAYEDGSAGEEEFQLSRDPAELLEEEDVPSRRRRRRRESYPLPGLDLLDEVQKEERGFSREVLQMNARLLKDTLANYGIEGQINEVRPGPVVTTFEFEPAPGVKVSQITSREDDLALAMRATRIRIEAPIPGKAAVGIEIPNPYPQTVGLKQVVGSLESQGNADPLAIAVGKDTEGDPFSADLADMPHLLVAGATGSGKSVCVNAIVCNLLLRNGPDRVRLLMIDPKMLELSVYNGIPHLMHPVITQPREALKAVKYMVAEMETRYGLLARHGVRNIAAFNEKVRKGKAKDEKTGEKVRETLPYCVLIIDELADLMMQLGSDLELPIARLAQMARAVGIHLVLATQRPSVNVITGVIKANFPSRIAFRVISKIDSRTIIDTGGAEQLLGKGDMLILLAGMPQPLRVHGAFISTEECERVVEYWMQYAEEQDELDLDAEGNGPGGVDLGEDDLLEEARRMVILSQSGSTTMLQRRLRVGYTRASRLMDMLEAEGVVAQNEGSKAREVLISKEELEADG